MHSYELEYAFLNPCKDTETSSSSLSGDGGRTGGGGQVWGEVWLCLFVPFLFLSQVRCRFKKKCKYIVFQKRKTCLNKTCVQSLPQIQGCMKKPSEGLVTVGVQYKRNDDALLRV